MKRSMVVFLVVILLSWTVAAVRPVSASPSDGSEAYDAFWTILNREAELVAQAKEGNTSILPELVNNSRLGSKNAVNISTLLWRSLQELESSGVKLYYTQDELREIAKNISRNGLPNETVQELKAQGWTDEQIKALEEYISQNADNITGDFNMSSFLQNLSTAFMRVAFKYDGYTAWAYEKLLKEENEGSLNLPIVAMINESEPVPLAWKDFLGFNSTYLGESLAGKITLIDELERNVLDLIGSNNWTVISHEFKTFLSKTSCPLLEGSNLSKVFENASLISSRLLNSSFTPIKVNLRESHAIGYYSTTTSFRVFLSGDYVVVVLKTVEVSQKVLNDCSIQSERRENYTIYYWRAFDTIKKLEDLRATLDALRLGNGNPKIREMNADILHSLRDAFLAEKVGSYEHYAVTIIRRPVPGDPIPPAKQIVPVDPSILQKTSGRTSIGTSSGTFLHVGVEVSSVDVTQYYATYNVTVALQAEGGSVSDVNVSVNGDGLSDSKDFPLITPSDGVVRWTTKTSSRIYGSGSVTVNGTVKVTYLVSHFTPTSTPVPVKDSGPSSGRRTVTKTYSQTIRLGTPISAEKVTFRVIPSKTTVSPGESVSFTVYIKNDNGVPINAAYDLAVTYPVETDTGTVHFSNSTIVERDSSVTLQAGSVSYPSVGTFHYSAELSFEGFSKTCEGDIVVSSNANNGTPQPSAGSLSISSVVFSPTYPKEGDTVTFQVNVYNNYAEDKDVKLRLSIDGSEVGSVGGSVSAGSTREFYLQWKAEAGEHSYKVMLYRVNEKSGKESLEDSEGGRINVARADQQFAVSLEAVPTELEGGGTVFFTVHVKNYLNSVLPLSGFVEDEKGVVIKKIDGFEGRIPANGEKNISFSYTIQGVGNYTFRVFLDNSDGKPNEIGEEHWAEVTVEVKPVGDVVASMSCDPTTVPLDSSTTCTVSFDLKSPATVTLNLEEVDFGGKRVWPDGPSSVTVNRKTITLTPTNMQDDLTITLTINDELANYYFGKPVYRTYLDKFAGHSYLIKAKFDKLPYSVSDVITIIYRDTRSRTDKIIDYGSEIGNIGGIVLMVVEGSNPVGWGILILSNLPNLGKLVSQIQWYIGDHEYSESDNNSVVGG